jgi:peptidoglycan hydrolase-like protein with peptidoglycan-binding domain
VAEDYEITPRPTMKDYSKVDFNGLVSRLFPNRAQLFSTAPLKMVGIRGADTPENQANSFAKYDDQFLVFINGSFASNWTCSVDPSWYFVVNPIVRDETGTLHSGQLCPGVHLFGRHVLHGKNPCYGQAEDVRLNRLNRDGTVNHVEVGDFAVCIHSGGAGMGTGRFSLACQILENPDGYFGNPFWNKFYLPVSDAMSRFSLDTFPYFLVDVADVIQAVTTPAGAATTPAATTTTPAIPVANAFRGLLSKLLGGVPALDDVAGGKGELQRATPSTNPVPGIDKVQDALIALGVPIDLGTGNANRGYFGPKTEAALKTYQQKTPGLKVTGTVDSETLFALDQGLLQLASTPTPVPAPPPGPPVITVVLPHLSGYTPPPLSRSLLGTVPLAQATPVGQKYMEKFAFLDRRPDNQDPSRCQVLCQLTGGILYFDAKMSVDTDGSPRARDIDPNPDDASLDTSWHYPNADPKARKVAFNSEEIPYIVLPVYDKNSRDDFFEDMGLQLGSIAVVIYGNKISGAIVADEGPTHKIGEGSVHLHELLGHNPWSKKNPNKILDASIDDNVLYFVFPDAIGSDLTPANAAQLIQERAQAHFKALGGTWT